LGKAELPVVEQSAPFLVVGVGASAGGLAATTELLANLGDDPELALVVVHHLDPSHESALVDILSRATALPVRLVVDPVRVTPNCVYVLPPNAGLQLNDGVLSCTPRESLDGRHLPIDQFFESLARDRGELSVGVVLSGTGSDGSRGIQAIRSVDGVTFAQDSSAEHQGMPESAIATGCVDFRLPPGGIAAELLRLGAARRRSGADDDRAFQEVISKLRATSGIDFVNYKQSTLRRRINRRMRAHGLRHLRDYAALVNAEPAELGLLFEDVLIHVTGFFRDPEVFEALQTKVFPRLIGNRRPETSIRVWVPACSTGEEVYSLAISLLEFLGQANASDIPIKLFGTDVSAQAIAKARIAKFPASIAESVSPGRLQRFFSKLENGYQIRRDVRDLCVFAEQDATRDPPFAGVDLISCRNLLIYLDTALQQRLLPIFHYALKDPGFLLLGAEESIRAFPGFVSVDEKCKIYARSAAAPRRVFDFVDGPPALRATSTITADGSASLPREIHREADRLVLAEFAPPGVVVTEDLAIVQFRGRTGPFLDPVPGTASFDLLRMVKADLRLPLRQTIDEARTKSEPVRRDGLRVGSGASALTVGLKAIPFRVPPSQQRYFIVLFEDETQAEEAAPAVEKASPVVQGQAQNALLQELASTRDYLQSVIEQAEASNEELLAANEESVSSNEELRSTNEELQTAKEELQATNQELRMINEEMVVRNADATRLSNDLNNVLNSAEIPVVLLGLDSIVRQFTPAAARALLIEPRDIGRTLGDVAALARIPGLAQLVDQVLERLTSVESTVEGDGGRWFQLYVRPYLTADKRIDGSVITAIDITALKQTSALVEEARRYAEGIVQAVRESLVVLNEQFRVRSVNRAFQRVFPRYGQDVVGKLFFELGHGEWATPALRGRLEAVAADGALLEDFRVVLPSEGADPRVLLLNARRIEDTSLLLLAIEDATERERAFDAVRRAERAFREMLTTASEAIIMSDAAGRITFANDAALAMFGYSLAEMLGLAVELLVPERERAAFEEDRSAYLSGDPLRPMARGRGRVRRRKDGREFPVEAVLGSLQTDDSRLVVSFITDMSERLAAEQKIADYQQKLQAMAFDAALTEERERRRIAVDLHDRIGQSLILAQIKLSAQREALSGEPRAAVEAALQLLAQSVNDTRSLIFELGPPVLYDLGLKPALAWLVEDLEKRSNLHVELRDDDAEKPLDEATAALVFRAVRELLVNVSKHAQAQTATLVLSRHGNQLQLDVEDTGVGFDQAARAGSGFGLFSVREQINRLGGTLEIASAPQHGTTVTLRVPLRRNSEPAPRPASNAEDR
jgi:two-component system CheB/CheR fusion protein